MPNFTRKSHYYKIKMEINYVNKKNLDDQHDNEGSLFVVDMNENMNQ